MGGQGMAAAVDTCRVRKVPQLIEATATQTPAWLSPPHAVKSLGRAVPPRSLPPALALALGVFAFIAMLKREFTSDTILDAYAGRLVANHGIPFHNTLTAVGYGREWIDQQWLGQLVIYAVQWAAGWPGVAALSAAAVALTGALSFRLLRERLSVLRCARGDDPRARRTGVEHGRPDADALLSALVRRALARRRAARAPDPPPRRSSCSRR